MPWKAGALSDVAIGLSPEPPEFAVRLFCDVAPRLSRDSYSDLAIGTASAFCRIEKFDVGVPCAARLDELS